MAREIIANADLLTLIELFASLCQKFDVGLDVWNFFYETRSDVLQAKMIELEDSDPSMAAILQKHIDHAKMVIDRKFSEKDS